MKWFNRKDKNINTPTSQKKELPDGMWYKTPGGSIVHISELKNNSDGCPEDDYHVHIGSKEYFEILFDGKFKEIGIHVAPVDFLKFQDQKKYSDRLKDAQNKTKLKDAIRVGYGKSHGKDLVIACMDFKFIGGSMGSVVGEKISMSIDYAIKRRSPLIVISKSGGARMMESATSLMQMAKTSAKLNDLSEAGLPYISLCTDPTTGGTTASFAMLGDINIAEPKALIAFAGPRVVKDTTGQDLPDGFQRSEFLLEKGFLDFITHRKDLKKKINLYIDLIQNNSLRKYD